MIQQRKYIVMVLCYNKLITAFGPNSAMANAAAVLVVASARVLLSAGTGYFIVD